MGSNQAHSSKIFLVEKEISVSAPPMMPPMPTGREPSPSQIMQMPGFESAFYAVQSADFSFGLGGADDDAVVADLVVIEGVESVAEFEHYIIGGVDDVIDAGYAGGFEAVFEPLRRGLNCCAANERAR